MKYLAPVMLLVVVIVLISFAAVKLSAKEALAEKKIIAPKQLSKINTFTSAVCETSGDFTYCRDEFFVNCNGTVVKVNDSLDCSGVKVDAPKALGFAVFEKNWKDPRK